MKHENEQWDEARWAALFAASENNAAMPDEEFLKRLREQTVREFSAHNQQKQLPLRRRNRMFIFALRGLAASAVTAVTAAIVFFSALSTSTAVPAEKVLSSLNQADSLHLSLTRDGKTSDIWTQKPNKLRWNNPDGTYKIAHGKLLWLVDEKANKASAVVSKYFLGGDGASGGLDLLALLDLPRPKRPDDLQFQRSAKPVQLDGKDYDDYQLDLPAETGKIHVRVLIDPSTQCLQSLEATTDRDGRLTPVCKLSVLAIDQPAPEDLFVVGDALTEDGRIGKITDVQGIVGLKPVMAERWTPVTTHIILKPGDWIRTDLRGSNAVALRLVKQTEVTLGPGSLAELVKPNQIRLFDGEIKVTAEEKSPVEIIGPNEQKLTIQGRQVLRLDKQKFVRLDKDPLWLKGFEGATTNESIGSLIAKVDGRDVPLTVGYHKVTVDIRDQIARTVIEESFVNHTPGRLEGVFHFPLPQDASISGFGMWIGSELVEADVVEKERAREIYETILRERRDPGLLEWSGGNIFKARVFPIEPNSEKRIKITYTQVLPLKGNQYRYSYPLQSELLKQNPLRELSIDLKLNSVSPVKNVKSPTHTVRTDKTEHSAHVEFTAQEYTPTRDFEVVVETAGQQSDVVVIPHRRGEDGYFMLQLTPPAENGQWQREILPDGEPMNLLILADTSASMDSPGRAAQADFLAALLSSLTPKDSFNLAGCDVDCDWVFEKSMSADAKNIETARNFLADRISLGWTDLDKAFSSALEQAGPKTQVIYIGDGIPTTRDADPVAFAKRLRRLYEGKTATLNAVTVSSSFEPVVVKTIASLGGGSLRQITGEHTPQAVAAELLQELARPDLKNLKIHFKNLRTARVYPEELPNIAAGSQQIVLGRYLPEGADQQGEVIVSGTFGGKPVRYASKVSLKDAEQGNSFIPRLWARMHLDSLLQEGASPAIKDEIIALSEEYHIITPYTSLLVLESDADRERFKVKRGFQMRDGEKFFVEGRDNANYELVQQQMKRAGNWRIGMRQAVLSQLAALGRNTQQGQQRGDVNYSRRAGVGGGSWFGDYSSSEGTLIINGPMATKSPDMNGLLLPVDGFDMLNSDGLDISMISGNREKQLDFESLAQDTRDEPFFTEQPLISDERLFGMDAESDFKTKSEKYDSGFVLGFPFEEDQKSKSLSYLGNKPQSMRELSQLVAGAWEFSEDGDKYYYDYSDRKPSMSGGRSFGLRSRGLMRGEAFAGYGYSSIQQQGEQWINSLFPSLPPAEKKSAVKEPQTKWSPEAIALAQSLLRSEQLAQLKGGLEINRVAETFDARWNNTTSLSETLSIVSPQKWLVRNQSGGSQTVVQWCNDKERGVMALAFQLGRLRASTPTDVAKPPVDLGLYTLSSLEKTYPQHQVELKPQGDNRTLLILKHPSSPLHETLIMIDTQRHVILWIEERQEGKITSSTKCDDFLEAAGAWWAGRIETFDAEGRRTSQTKQQFKPLSTEATSELIAAELSGREKVQFIHEPLPKLIAAKQAIADKKATFEDQIVMLVHFAGSQQWTRAGEHLEEAEKLADGKAGMRWLRNAFLNSARRGEELKDRMFAEARQLAQAQPDGKRDSNELFLANHLLGQSSGVLEANEMLNLLDVLRPVFERQPKYVLGMKQWTQQRANYLQQTGRSDEWLALQKQLASDYPHDANLQQQYAQNMANSNDYETAYAWINRVLNDNEARWLPYEEEMLRNCYCQLFERQGRYPELVDYLAGWLKKNPQSVSPYQQYLTALIKSNREKEANSLIEQWMKDGQTPNRLSPETDSRLQAAVNQALGQGRNLYTDRIEQRWLKPLADVALFFARSESQQNIANTIMNNWRFQQSDQCRDVRKAAVEILKSEIDKLPPMQITRFVSWITPNNPVVEKDVWKRFAAELHKRWASETDPGVKGQYAQMLNQILSAQIGAEEYIAFLREQWEKATDENRPACAAALFNVLIQQTWSVDRENELFSLLDKLSNAEEPAQRLAAEVAALHRLTDRMLQTRFESSMAKIEHQENLTRTELAAKKVENMRLAREESSDRLQKEMQKRTGGIVPWMNIERLYLDVLLGRNLDRVAEECWEFLGPKPTIASVDDEGAALKIALHQRYLITLMNLAARKEAKPEISERLLIYFDDGIAIDRESNRWKMLKYQLLVALDRPKELEQALQSWIKPGDADNFWRMTLAYILAEQGKIDEAIKLFEFIKATDELGPAEYRTLADWYMVMNQRELYERSIVASLKSNEEWQLSNWLSQRLRPWQQHNAKPPAELDKEVMQVFTALFEKSSNPQNYLWQLREFYINSRDFRLLAGMADAAVGHTAGKVYPFLQGMKSVISEIRDEASVDSLIEQLTKVRDRAKTDIDRRALDMLEVLVERRATELKNQPGPHADKALQALQRAFKGQWSAGETRLMADYLASLGAIPDAIMAEEQVRQLRVLHQEAKVGTLDRLHIALRLANAHWNYSKQEQAIDLLQSSLEEYQNATNGILPAAANEALGTFVSYLEQTRHYDRGEKTLHDQLRHPANEQQTNWLTQRLYELYENAIRNNGDVSLGNGETLYRTVQQKIQTLLDSGDENHRSALINRLCGIYRAAHEKKFSGVADDLKTFAMKRLPEVLTRQTNNYQSSVIAVGNTLHDVAGARDALAFLIERVEQEPEWFRLNNRDAWSQFGWQIAEWRCETKVLGDLEERLLKIVLAELRRDLQSRQTHNAAIYRFNHAGNERFWAEKADAFAKTAEEVLAEHNKSSADVVYIAQYFYHGLRRYDRAIEILLTANRDKVLDESGQSELVQRLRDQNRHAECIPILLPLVETRLDNMQYRVWLMNAYFHTGHPAELAELLKQTDAYFHESNRWNEGAMAALGAGCLENQLYAQSVAYYKELIPLHQRSQPRRGIGNGTLSDYYGKMALAYAGLKQTADAVDAACGAIISWGPRIDQRKQATESLKQVLRQSPDLDAYVAELDKQSADTGLQNPIVRKALGQIYAEKQQYAKAIAQLKLACELQPNDTETYRQLIDCYDKQGDKTGAIEQLLQAVQLSRRDIALYQDLGKRYETLGKSKETERAYTSIVEVLPLESESHTSLAEIRQNQNRWSEAADQWQEVAKLRSLEPTGLLKLAAAQIHTRQWDAAEQTLRKLETTSWPARFGDVYGQASQLRRQLQDQRK